MERTLFEINWRIDEIFKRLNLEREFEMAIHGISPQKRAGEEPKRNITKDQEKAMEIALKRAKERKRVEFLNRKK